MHSINEKKKFTNKRFVSNHPSGSLATSLIQVKEIMVTGKKVPIISSKKTMKFAINEMTKKKLGIVCVKNNSAIMLISDGDLRRHSNNLYKKKVIEVATENPNWVADTDTALSAINRMSSLNITSLLVTSKKNLKKKNKNLLGVIHLHHCLSRGIK